MSSYLDDELDANQRTALERHLDECPRCVSLLEDLRLLSSVTKNEEIPALPDDLSERIARKLPLPMTARRRSWIYRMPLAAAAGLAGAALLWVAFQTGPTPLKEAVMGQKSSSELSNENVAKDETLPMSETQGQAGDETNAREDTPSDLRDVDESSPATAASPVPPAKPDASRLSRLSGAEIAPRPTPELVPEVSEGEEQHSRVEQKKSLAAPTRSKAPLERQAVGARILALREENQRATRKLDRRVLAAEGDIPRAILLDGPGYRMTLFETGALTLLAEGYDCTVTGPTVPAKAESLDTGDVAFLDRFFASSMDAPQAVGGTASDPAQDERVAGRETHAQILERYRARLEAQCGSLPLGIEPPK